MRLLALAAALTLAGLGAFTTRLPGGTPVLPATPYAYTPTLPAHLRAPGVLAEDNTPAANPTTDDGATLGRVLFYDTRLSLNETVSCASCHKQAHGFSDSERLSAGFEGEPTARNSMGLSFARYYRNGRFFWDERAQTLEHQVLQPIEDTVEMGMTLGGVTERLGATDFYPALFARAFGSPAVTPERVSLALSQFVRSIAPAGSRYDAARQAQGGPPGRPLAGLTAQENQGLSLFFGRGQCAQCHTTDLFVGDQARNNGLDATVTDAGAGGGRFKTGSLRNVALTAPYMHDGRFATLDAVVQHYSTGVQNSPTLDNRLRGPNGQPVRLNLNVAERASLVAFLEALSDPALATEPRWSNPFASGATAAEPTPSATTFEMAGPNPVRGQTALRVRLAAPADVRLDIYSATGRHVATLLDGQLPGDVTARWDASGVAAGTYVARLSVGGAVLTRTLTVVR